MSHLRFQIAFDPWQVHMRMRQVNEHLWRLAPGNQGLIWSSRWALVPVSSMHFCTYTSGLLTWWSTRALQVRRPGNPYLGAGFPLRCFQRLSFPDLATRPCPERDNRCTSGRYFLILSY